MKRKFLELFGGEEVKRILKALDGHKTELGLVVAAAPDIANQLVELLQALIPVFSALHMDGPVAYITRACGLILAGVGGIGRAWKVLDAILKDTPKPPAGAAPTGGGGEKAEAQAPPPGASWRNAVTGTSVIYRVIKRAPTATTVEATFLALALLLLPAFASAQTQVVPEKTAEVSLYGGAMQFAERGKEDKRDFVYRLSASLRVPQGVVLFGRVDYTRTQDGGDLLDIKTFRSVEGFAGARKEIAPGFSPLVYAGVSWDRDSKVQPTDPRLWTLAAGFRYDVPGRGYLIASAGHHGPVGGSAFLGSVVVTIRDGVSWFGDVSIPLDASRFAQRPYTIKAGISARLKAWRF